MCKQLSSGLFKNFIYKLCVHKRYNIYMHKQDLAVNDPQVVWISETKLDFYHSRFSDYCLHFYCFIPNVSADMSSDLQMFLSNSGACTELRSTSFIYSACSDFVNHNRVEVLSISILLLTCPQD